ncbi:MAG: hypothetical protein PHI36_02665 [Bacteroidales bacterium]|nr:hypothetical protein [Bacteroidales bacterium]
MFASELEMSELFEKFIKLNFGNAYLKECQGLSGIPDYVFYDKKKENTSIIAFELKLKNWKRAMRQAFRYRCFSNIVYVVLPEETAKSAKSNVSLFEQYNIGLATFNRDKDFNVVYKPQMSMPFSECLNVKISEQIKSSRKKLKNSKILMN